MLKVVIIEDEKLALEHIKQSLIEIDHDIQIITCLNDVAESIAYFSQPVSVDLIISDVQLSDGLSFEVFKQCEIPTPVIFTTGYDEFMMNALEYNGIDYLLKPVSPIQLLKAIQKYKMLEKHFQNHKGLHQLINYVSDHKRKRILVRKGLETISLLLEDIVLFYTENKLVYVLDKSGKKYLSDNNLTELEKSLDPRMFFRANRQYIININFIRGFKAYEKVKLWIDLSLPEICHDIIISQEMAPQFKDWMSNA